MKNAFNDRNDFMLERPRHDCVRVMIPSVRPEPDLKLPIALGTLLPSPRLRLVVGRGWAAQFSCGRNQIVLPRADPDKPEPRL
jgi:hypothetical protein